MPRPEIPHSPGQPHRRHYGSRVLVGLFIFGIVGSLRIHETIAQNEPFLLLDGSPDAGAPAESAEEVAVRVITVNIQVLMARKAYDTAVSELERLLRRAPDQFPVQLLATEIYFYLGQDLRVKEHAAHASELDPSSIEPYRWLARLARWRGDLEEARKHLKSALELEPDRTGLRTELATLHAAEGHYMRAQRNYRRAVRGEPDDARAAMEAALRLRNPKRRDDALRRLSERFPDDSRIQSWAALCREIEGRKFWQAQPHLSPVSVPMRIDAQHFATVGAQIGDQINVRLLLDTGTSGLKLTEEVARRAGVQTFGPLSISGLGSERAPRARLGLLKQMKLGPLTLHDVPVTVLESLPKGDGLFNPRSIGTEAVRFDVSRRKLLLGSRVDLLPEGSEPRRFFEIEEHLLVHLYLNGRSRHAMLDSGSGATILDVSLVREIPQRRPMLFEGMTFSLSGVVGEVKEAKPIHVSRLNLGDLVVQNSILFEADLSLFGAYLGTDVELLLGADYLSRYDTTLDYRAMEMTLEPVQKKRRRRIRSDP
ncbi:MAG: aspartyl protease family protein [Acidobacteria bacterium]|nr:aspartyl protease family protein [Acidobacteriota bacterium]